MKKLLYSAVFCLALASCSKSETSYVDPLKERDAKKVEISGTLKFSDGTPAAGVVVSDGYSCAQTAADGTYTLTKNDDAYYVFYSIPSDAAVEVGSDGLPCFYTKVESNKTQYDFTLTKQSVQTKFRMLAVGDIQVKNDANISRFKGETLPDLKKFGSANNDLPIYAIHLGDLGFNTWNIYPSIIPQIAKSATGIPMFMVIGNHDHEYPVNGNLPAQRKYEAKCGPVNYSFNIGDVHFISMDDVLHTGEASAKYDGGFLTTQYEWLKQDLSYVSKDKHVVLAVHIPFRDAFYTNYGVGKSLGLPTGCYYNEVLALMAQFQEATIFSGHLHQIRNSYTHQSGKKTIQEYGPGAACGGLWTSVSCWDGAPNGYEVVEFDGTTIKDLYYKGVNFDKGHQMRIYYAPDFPSFKYTLSSETIDGSWPLVTEANTYIINVWNSLPGWETEVYEDGVKQGSLNRKDFRDLFVMYSYYNAAQYSHLDETDGKWDHMYYYRPKNPSFTTLKVVAKDPYGNVYECDKITKPGDNCVMSY